MNAVASAVAEPFPLTSHPEADLMPALSPDGKWLAYVSRQNKNYDIWVKPAAGGLATALTTNTSDDYSPSWSPDSKALVFVSRRDDAEGDLYLLKLEPREDGFAPGKLQRLTVNFVRESHPAFSPDAKRIAYSVGASGTEQIWLYELKSKKTYALTRRGGTQPAWSPEGRTLAISCPAAAGEGHQIFLINSDTTQADYLRRQITFAGDNLFPSFSKDGQKLLVQRFDRSVATGTNFDPAGHRGHLRAVAFEGVTASLNQPSHELRLTPARENALFPFWGSDGAVYYAADHYGNFDLWRLPESGPVPRFSSPREAFANAQKIADPEIASLAFSALRFYFPDSAEWLARAGLEIGRRYLDLQDTAQARETFEEVAEKHGDRLEAGLFAEYELARLSRLPQRLEEIFARASTWPAVRAFCRLETGLILQSTGKREEALRTLQLVPQQFPEVQQACYKAWLGAGKILLALERPEEAEASFVAIVNNYPEHLQWRTTAIQHLLDAAPRSSLTADTLAAYQRFVQKYATLPVVACGARFRIAERLARDVENVLADNEYRELLSFLQTQNDPYLQALKAETVLRLMRVQIAGNDFPAAVQLYSKFLEHVADTSAGGAVLTAQAELTDALVRRGYLVVRAQDPELALSLFSQARQLDARHIEAHRGYVGAMNALGRIGEAAAEYQQSAARAPDNEILVYTLGLAYSYQGQNDVKLLRRSAELIERALALNYRLVPAYLTLSFNYEGLEQLEQKERARKKGMFEKAALALPRLLDNVRRTVTFRPPKARERWYERAIEVLTVALALNDETADPQREAQLALNLGNNHYNLGEFSFENAYRYFRVKLQYDSTFTDLRQKMLICERIGHAGWVAGKAREAAPFLKQATVLAQELRAVDTELRNLLRLALLYQEEQDYESSITYYRQFINASRRENRTNDIASAWRQIASNRQQLSEADDAVDKGQRSLSLMQQAGSGSFPEPTKNKLRVKFFGLPVFWWTVEPAGEESSSEGLSYEQQQELVFSIIEESWTARKEYGSAIKTLEQKAASFRQRKYLTGEAVALNNLGILWYNLRDFHKAGTYFLQSFRLCDRQQLHAGKIINLINLGNLAMLQQCWGKEAVPLVIPLDSLLQVSQASLAAVSLQSPRQRLAVFNTLGNLYYYSAHQNWSGASSHSLQASNGSPREDLQQQIQRTLLAMQSLARARAAYDTALTLAQTFHLPREAVMLRRNLASLLMLAGDYPSAWEHLTLALEACLADNFSELTWRVAHALGTLRRSYVPPADEPLAQTSPQQWYDQAIAILEVLPGDSEGSGNAQSISEAEEQRELYENTVSLLSELRVSNGATDSLARVSLSYVERSHASRFVNLLATRYILPKKERHRLIWGGSGGQAADQRRVLSQWRGELRKLEAEETPRPKELARVRAELAQAEKDYRKIVQDALAEDPELASFFSVQPVDLHAVQNHLHKDQAVLQYFLTHKELLIWLVAADRVEQFRVPCSKEKLRQLVAAVRSAWQLRQAESHEPAAQLSALL
ncbi:MAG: tetratricopeptide repeat protein, partial [bacterium]